MNAVASRLKQLQQAKDLVDNDPSFFTQIVVGLLPLTSDPEVVVQRWVADFLLQAFSSVQLDTEAKLDLSLKCLETLCTLMVQGRDVPTTKSVIQAATIAYPLLFRHVALHPQASEIWKRTSALKSAIMGYWDGAHEGLRVCCFKFAQRVIATQMKGAKDPRLADKLDISLLLVQPQHPLLHETELTAEAQGLLDRMCFTLTDQPTIPGILTACINCLCVLVKIRPSAANKIISAILALDTSKLVEQDGTMKAKLQAKFVDKTIRLALTHLLKHNAAGPLGNRIQQNLLGTARRDEELNKKRAAVEATDPTAKRLKLGDAVDGRGTPTPNVLSIPPLPEGPVSLATVFNLANDNALAAFDVHQLPSHLVNQIVLASLAAVDLEKLAAAVQTTRDRYAAVQLRASAAATTATDLVPGKSADTSLQAPVFAQVFKMPEPPEQTPATLQQLCTSLCARVLASRATAEAASSQSLGVTGKQQRPGGLAKRLGAAWDKESWLFMTIRLASRGLGREGLEESAKSGQALSKNGSVGGVSQAAREMLYAYIMQDFRSRLDVCTAWLTEEWYHEQVCLTRAPDMAQPSRYETLALRVLDGILPFIEGKDRLFMRFLSDLPDLTVSLIGRLRVFCLDPDRSALGYTTLQYLVMLRPPVREICLDVVERLYMEDKSELAQQEKILKRWRPAAIDAAAVAKQEAAVPMQVGA
ncbi:hypothetical protein BCR37DRAFT_379792 [Protomyces lactucae-debilis]|uniref:Symplekin/Pta1 N-terminal domain-containing protein n=1 Tax=Protomyces lactucae-debilis TaxID=2754530 RepID=A0A1Y2FD92_PROLT|nr:uncharacterized protein BCR37DRAFT_379792 [Protomyces lactucae-debilis]ORY81893.1 hypothetical protein BCR37DRAFT_379792 [Protomyces lactucae-debilis]